MEVAAGLPRHFRPRGDGPTPPCGELNLPLQYGAVGLLIKSFVKRVPESRETIAGREVAAGLPLHMSGVLRTAMAG